jgi:hypothetical protein
MMKKILIWLCEFCKHSNKYKTDHEDCNITQICENCNELNWDPCVEEIWEYVKEKVLND